MSLGRAEAATATAFPDGAMTVPGGNNYIFFFLRLLVWYDMVWWHFQHGIAVTMYVSLEMAMLVEHVVAGSRLVTYVVTVWEFTQRFTSKLIRYGCWGCCISDWIGYLVFPIGIWESE